MDKKCPDCGERLSIDATRCACGWGAPKRGDRTGPRFDTRCTFKANGARCCYPVAMFPEGATSGWCIAHRRELQPGDGARIVRESQTVPYTEVLEQIHLETVNSPLVAAEREAMRLRRGANRSVDYDDARDFLPAAHHIAGLAPSQLQAAST